MARLEDWCTGGYESRPYRTKQHFRPTKLFSGCLSRQVVYHTRMSFPGISGGEFAPCLIFRNW